MFDSRNGRRWGVVALVVFLMLGLVVAGAAAYDHSHASRLAHGIRIDGVDVGGLSASEAARRIQTRALQIRSRSLYVHARGKTFAIPAGSVKVTAEVDDAITKALADSRRGWFGSRVVRDIGGGHVSESIALRTRYTPGVIPRFVKRIARATNKPAVDASVKPAASGLDKVSGHDGIAVQTGTLRQMIASALLHPTHAASIKAPLRGVKPKITKQQLAKKYPAYIIIDRKAHQLRFYEHLKPWHTWPIAVGRAGLETPSGLYDVQWKETNPSWHVPNSAWAGSLAGQTIPPGPDDPIKSRWMAFNGGAGIHGIDPSEYGSIGQDASHGCVRMRIPDVISLYSRTPVGTPVFVA
ncbi:MAG: L,D-transpeptidase ErfK/SrfK [Solirubrobacteraceae bacterium]|nr:L,D-transpeptidase ErfK/SrfK [Solirubrobacteraceae bacterium]